MLVLTRRIGEEIIIGDNIRVKIVSIKGDRIRVGIEAPSTVTVDRAEIFARRTEFAETRPAVRSVNGQIDDPLAEVLLGELPDHHVSFSSAETLKH